MACSSIARRRLLRVELQPGEDWKCTEVLPPFLVSAEDACQAVDSANDLMASAVRGRAVRGTGTLAAEIWGTAAESEELTNWLRRQCGATSLEMAYEAELSVNGSVPRATTDLGTRVCCEKVEDPDPLSTPVGWRRAPHRCAEARTGHVDDLVMHQRKRTHIHSCAKQPKRRKIGTYSLGQALQNVHRQRA